MLLQVSLLYGGSTAWHIKVTSRLPRPKTQAKYKRKTVSFLAIQSAHAVILVTVKAKASILTSAQCKIHFCCTSSCEAVHLISTQKIRDPIYIIHYTNVKIIKLLECFWKSQAQSVENSWTILNFLLTTI